MRPFSLQQRLPLLICLLLLAVMTTFTIVSYYSIRKVTVNSAKNRIQAVSDQLTGMFGQQAQQSILNYRAFTTIPEVKQFLLTQDDELKPAVFAGMHKLYNDSLVVLLELIDNNYNPLLIYTRDSIEKYSDIKTLRVNAISADSSHVGRFHFINGHIYHSVKAVIPLPGAESGYVLGWRRVATTNATLRQFSELLGSDAHIYIGNRDHSLWTNFVTRVENPMPANVQPSSQPGIFRTPQGESILGSFRNIPNSSWSFLVGFSRKNVVSSANTFLKWMIVIGAFLNLIAIVVTWFMSRKLTRPLKQLTVAASSIANGNYKSSVNVNRIDEIGKLSRAFNAMSHQVNRSKVDLENKVVETQQMTNRLRELSAHLQNIREEERIHIAREMHDELGQLLTGFKMDVSWLHKRLEKNEEPAIREKLEEMMEIVNDAARFVRRIASELRPSILDDLGLIPALDWHSQEFGRRSNLHISFNAKMEDLDTSKETATGIFRIYQESLTNVARHADARKVVAELELTDGNILLTITDDGKGFDTKSGERKTLGILGMRERAAMLGGQLKIYSAPGKGTTVLITIPQHQTAAFSSV